MLIIYDLIIREKKKSVLFIENGQFYYDIVFRLFFCWLVEKFFFMIFMLCFQFKVYDYDFSYIIDFMVMCMVFQKYYLKLRKCEVICYMDSCNDK